MKFQTIQVLIFVFFFSILSSSCNKKEINTNENDNVVLSNSKIDFEKDYEAVLSLIDEDSYLLITSDENGVTNYDVIGKLKSAPLVENNLTDSNPYATERCRGKTNYSFAKCVKNAVDKYGCQTISKDGEEYVSSDC